MEAVDGGNATAVQMHLIVFHVVRKSPQRRKRTGRRKQLSCRLPQTLLGLDANMLTVTGNRRVFP